MKFSSVWGAVKKIGQFAYEHPEVFEVAAASTGHAGLASDIATVVAAKNAASAAKNGVPPAAPAPAPVTQAPVEPVPVAPAPAPVEPTGPVPEVDLVGKWRGTLNRMAHEVINKDMPEDEMYNNAKLLEKGDVAGVVANLQAKQDHK